MSSPRKSIIDWMLIGLETRLNARLDKIQQSINDLKIEDVEIARIKAATGQLTGQADTLKGIIDVNRPK